MTEPTRVGSLVGPYSCVHDVAKKCYECGKEWEGKAFTEQPANAPRLPGICAECIDKSDARLAELTRGVVATGPTADMDLTPPRPVGNVDDLPIDRKMLAAHDVGGAP